MQVVYGVAPSCGFFDPLPWLLRSSPSFSDVNLWSPGFYNPRLLPSSFRDDLFDLDGPGFERSSVFTFSLLPRYSSPRNGPADLYGLGFHGFCRVLLPSVLQ